MTNSIDYGNGLTNIDHDNGIRYGVIPHGAVGSAWYDESEAKYGKPTCPDCFNELDNSEDFEDDTIEDEYYCSHCQKGIDGYREDIYPEEPLSFDYEQDGYAAQQTDGVDIFILKSDYYTLCNYCSPCAPGAGYLLSEGTIKAYCFAPDWFEDEEAPYKVYSVKTGKEV